MLCRLLERPPSVSNIRQVQIESAAFCSHSRLGEMGSSASSEQKLHQRFTSDPVGYVTLKVYVSALLLPPEGNSFTLNALDVYSQTKQAEQEANLCKNLIPGTETAAAIVPAAVTALLYASKIMRSSCIMYVWSSLGPSHLIFHSVGKPANTRL